MVIETILRAFNPKVYDAIQSYRVKDDSLMPLAYRNIVGGRKQDVTVTLDENLNPKSDIMEWWDPPSLSWNKI